MNVRDASHLPVRTREAAYFWNVSGKSMITQPLGLPPTSCPISLSKFAWSGFQEMFDADLAAELRELRRRRAA